MQAAITEARMDWQRQIKYVAYAFSIWNRAAFPQLKQRGFLNAFSLAEKRDQTYSFFVIRRITVSRYGLPRTPRNSIVQVFFNAVN